MNNAGGRLKECRRLAGVTQEHLAHEVGVTTRTIQKIEAGQSVPGVHLALRISRFLKRSVEFLFGDAEEAA